MNILSIIGARPQFIKSASLSRKLRQKHNEILVHTGQHYDSNMSEIFFKELNIPEPDYNLGIGSASQGEQTGKMLMEIDKILTKEEPELVIVYGDTNSTIAGALASSKLQIPVAHVEAGLRSFDKTMPEEINRILTDHISDILFCPTNTAVENLLNEGITKRVFNVGDVMIDALEYNRKIADSRSTIIEYLELEPRNYILVTCHRPVNTDNQVNLESIIKALSDSGENIIFPVHPRTDKCLEKYCLKDKIGSNVKLIPPVGYLDMLKLMSGCKKVVTDSGGVQKEAYMLNIPCITLRNTTEWIETIDSEWNVLVGADYEKITRMIKEFEPNKMRTNIFGALGASNKIAQIIEKYYE